MKNVPEDKYVIQFIHMQKLIRNIWKIVVKTKNHRILIIWIEDTSYFGEDFYYTWKNVKESYKNSKLKISAPTWNEEFELPNGSYSTSDIQDHFEKIWRNMEKRLLILQQKYM